MRPQGKVKVGFYPTPPRVVEEIAHLLSCQSHNARFRILDPCAGDGAALALLVKCLREEHERDHGKWSDFDVTTYGIEIQSLLAPQAEEKLDHVLQTSFFTTTLSHGDTGDKGWQCIYLNPPYDDDLNAQTGSRKEREEFKFLKRATLLLSPHGILVFIVPQYVLSRPGVARYLAQYYDKHQCFRFPDETWRPVGMTCDVSMYEQFRQVVFIGCKRPKALPYTPDDEALKASLANIEEWVNMGNLLTPLPLHGNTVQYTIPNAPAGVELKYFMQGAFDPDRAASSVGQFVSKTGRPRSGVWGNADYWSARFPDPRKVGLSVGSPLQKFKRGYLIVFAVAGLLNHATLVGRDSRRVLVKGHTRKTMHYSVQDGEWEKVEKNTERYESSLWCTDLDTGDLILVQTGEAISVEWDLTYETMSMQEFLEEFGESLMQQVMQFNAPRYQSARQVPWAKQGFSLVKRKPLGKQLDTILAQVNALVNRWHGGGIGSDTLVSRLASIAEMASGKTYMAICTAFLADVYACGGAELVSSVTKKLPFFPAVILTPPIMAPKWKREIEQTIPNARVLIIERFGALRDPDDDDEEFGDERQSKKSFSDAASAFRQFDPSFTGTSLGTVGSVDRAVMVIERELQDWQRDYDEVVSYNCAVRTGAQSGEILALPLKPCHVIILTFNTARSMPPWMPIYQMKPMRYRDVDSGKLKLVRTSNGSPAMVPCCPSCGRAIKDEKSAMRELYKKGSDYQQMQQRLTEERNKRAKEGLRLAQKLAAYDERIREWEGEKDAEYQKLLAARNQVAETLTVAPRRLSTFEEEEAEEVYLYLSEAQLLGTKDHRIKRNCSECGEALWQYIVTKPKQEWVPCSVKNLLPMRTELRAYGQSTLVQYISCQSSKSLPLPERDWLPPCVATTYQRRWAIADYIADQYPGFFKFLIADEVHEGADGTALDQARQLLTLACGGRMIGLTGTLSNGYASSLFRLFYVIMRQVRERYGYDDTKRWIADHGKMQMVQKSKYEEAPRGDGSDSKRKISPGMPVYREIAGFDATGMGLVAQSSTFTELKDVVPSLVGYKEEVRVVDMGKELGQAYSTFEREATLELGRLLATGNTSALSPWYTALLTYPDVPWLGWVCKTKYGNLLAEAPALPEDVVYPIERALIDYVQEQYDSKFPVLVYTENSGQYDDQDRLKYLFETKVRGRDGKKLKVAILRSTTTKKTMDREAWLARCVEDGIDVLICNPALVKVGLDLIHFKRIAYKRTPRKVTDLRQSSRRSLRPGQDTDVEVVFFTYKGSMALHLLHLMARKAQSSLMVEGKIATEGLVSLGFDEEEDEGDIMGRMAREMVEQLREGSNVASEKMAEELQELTRSSIEIERRQNLDVGEQDEAAQIIMEAITTAPVVASANYYEDVTTAVSAQKQAIVDAAQAEPISVTTVPVSVSDDPWAATIAVQAAQDVWSLLRQQLGPKKGGRRRK